MQLTLSNVSLAEYVCTQLNNVFPDEVLSVDASFIKSVDGALELVKNCFKHIDNKYYFDGKNIIFNHRNADQYCVFLYWLSRISAFECSRKDIAEKTYLLNKILNGIDIFYEVELPLIFAVVHPLGTVLGRAEYKNFLLVYQRCGVGTNKGKAPRLGCHLTLHPGASILGDCNVGDFCSVGANSLVIDQNLPDDTVFVGNPSSHKILTQPRGMGFWRSCDQT